MSKAATITGTRRRHEMELAELDRAARVAAPELTMSQRRRAIRELHRRAIRGHR